MKTFQDIQNDYAEEEGYSCWAEYIENRLTFSPAINNMLAERYADYKVNKALLNQEITINAEDINFYKTKRI